MKLSWVFCGVDTMESSLIGTIKISVNGHQSVKDAASQAMCLSFKSKPYVQTPSSLSKLLQALLDMTFRPPLQSLSPPETECVCPLESRSSSPTTHMGGLPHEAV